MFAAGRSAQTIRTYTTLAKMIIGSVKDAKGQLIPRKWDRDEIDAPAIKKQRQPVFPAATISALIERSSGAERMLYALLAGTGMRVGEALGLNVSNVAPDCRSISVKKSLWQNRIVTPKTEAATRTIELCEPLADMLREFIGTRTQGLLFQNRSGRGLAQSNDIRRHLHPLLRELGCELQGFHGFRRFRVTHLRLQRLPEGLIRYWIGHSGKTVTDKYDKQEDANIRLESANKVGLGFEIRPSVVRIVRKIESAVEGRNAQIAA
jgi:integrase